MRPGVGAPREVGGNFSLNPWRALDGPRSPSVQHFLCTAKWMARRQQIFHHFSTNITQTPRITRTSTASAERQQSYNTLFTTPLSSKCCSHNLWGLRSGKNTSRVDWTEAASHISIIGAWEFHSKTPSFELAESADEKWQNLASPVTAAAGAAYRRCENLADRS